MKNADIKKLDFVKRICLSISGILLCLSSLGFSSFALFTNNSSSLANSVVSAGYNLFVDIDGNPFPTDTAISWAKEHTSSIILDLPITEPLIQLTAVQNLIK